MYEGDFVNGEKHGKGKLVTFDGDVYEGDWTHDKRHGTIIISGAGKTTVISTWKEGEIINAQEYNQFQQL